MSRSRGLSGAVVATLTALVAINGWVAAAPTAQERIPGGRARNPGLPGWCETPVADRKAEPGCYTTAIAEYIARRTGEEITARLDRVYGAAERKGISALPAERPPLSRADHW